MMKTKIFFLLSILLIVCLSGSFVRAEAEHRREPFKPLIGQAELETITPVVPPMENPGPLQKFEAQQLRVTGHHSWRFRNVCNSSGS